MVKFNDVGEFEIIDSELARVFAGGTDAALEVVGGRILGVSPNILEPICGSTDGMCNNNFCHNTSCGNNHCYKINPVCY